MHAKYVPFESFRVLAWPIIHDFVRTTGQPPYQTWLRKNGLGWIVYASDKHYGGYHRSLRRLGFKPPIRPMIQQPGKRPQGYWSSDKNILTELRRTFPDELAWDTMPSVHMIQAKLPGLGSRILHVESIVSMSRRLGLLTFYPGNRARRRTEGIIWLLDFYERTGRWPIARECPSSVRGYRYVKGMTWHDFCRPKGMPRASLLRLINRFHQHRAWLRDHRPEKMLVRQRVLNHLIIELAHRFPTV